VRSTVVPHGATGVTVLNTDSVTSRTIPAAISFQTTEDRRPAAHAHRQAPIFPCRHVRAAPHRGARFGARSSLVGRIRIQP
jgi:hypothetical protein